MLDTQTNSDPATDLRYALDVMEEYSHLGLDEEYASKLRDILQRHIREAEDAFSCSPAGLVHFPRGQKKISA
jgi:hypothetical protein